MPPHAPEFLIVAENNEKKIVLQQQVEHIDNNMEAVVYNVNHFFETFPDLYKELQERLLHRIEKYYPKETSNGCANESTTTIVITVCVYKWCVTVTIKRNIGYE